MESEQPDDPVTALAHVIGGAMILRTSPEEIVRAILASGFIVPKADVEALAQQWEDDPTRLAGGYYADELRTCIAAGEW